MRAMSGVQGEQKGKDKVEDRERDFNLGEKERSSIFLKGS